MNLLCLQPIWGKPDNRSYRSPYKFYSKKITMKQQYKIIFLSMSLLFVNIYLKAQIGINTESPRGIFHVDPKSNTPASGIPAAGLVVDDILVDGEGNMGIGTIFPQAKMHIVTGGTSTNPKTGFRMDDGNQLNLRVLLSNTDGAGRWADAPSVPSAIATKVGVNIPSTAANYYNTNSYIDLPPGRWLVTSTTLLYSGASSITIEDKQWVHAFFTESSAASGVAISPDVEGSQRMAGLITKSTYSILNGNCVINNKTSTTKKYYFAVGAFGQVGTNQGNVTYSNVAGTANNENSIIALLLQDSGDLF